MTNQNSLSVQNNFVAGFKTEYTGLNFPENAATSTSNTIYTLTGDVTRRGGFNFETNSTTDTVNRTGLAMSTYKWNNVGGDGSTQLIVRQIGKNLYFYLASAATVASPLSTQKLNALIDISSFQALSNANNVAVTECTYADGNGYLFVYHPDCDPFYCTFSTGSLTTANVNPNKITIQIRDFVGVYPEPGSPNINARPATLTNEHNYNLQNQGWTSTSIWATQSVDSVANRNIVLGWASVNGLLTWPTGNITLVVPAGIAGASAGQAVIVRVDGTLNWVRSDGAQFLTGYNVPSNSSGLQGVVVSYSGTSMVINVTQAGGTFQAPGPVGALLQATFTISLSNTANMISTFQNPSTGLGVYPSNGDVWFTFKDTSNKFNPIGTFQNVATSIAQAPNGHFLLPAFVQNRTSTTGISGITTVSTTARPTNGCWFAGRVWYTGANASQAATGDVGYYTWTENIYFSQIITDPTGFGHCYQENDPTGEDLFDLQPTDGGVIVVQGSGPIYKLFPVQNGLMVFAANGVWFITGSQGIGFAANDYTLTKIPNSPLITSGTSFVNIQGWPIFWNEEGIYTCTMGQNGGIQIQNICVGTILTYYSNIPLQSKKFARGDYSQVDYIVEWCFRSTNESSVTDRYQFDTILALNTVNKAFYIYNLPAGTPYVHSVNYVAGPGGSTSPMPTFKYLTSYANAGSFKFTWSEENDFTHYKDWFSFDSAGVNYISSFATAYKLDGKAIAKWQPTYTYVFLRNAVNNSYKIQGLWEFATAGNSGKWSTVQVINDTTNTTNFGMVYHRHKIRGRGLVLQLQFTSVDGKPFDIMGWTVWENINTGP